MGMSDDNRLRMKSIDGSACDHSLLTEWLYHNNNNNYY